MTRAKAKQDDSRRKDETPRQDETPPPIKRVRGAAKTGIRAGKAQQKE